MLRLFYVSIARFYLATFHLFLIRLNILVDCLSLLRFV